MSGSLRSAPRTRHGRAAGQGADHRPQPRAAGATDAPLIKMRTILLEAARDLQRGIEPTTPGIPRAFRPSRSNRVAAHRARSRPRRMSRLFCSPIPAPGGPRYPPQGRADDTLVRELPVAPLSPASRSAWPTAAGNRQPSVVARRYRGSSPDRLRCARARSERGEVRGAGPLIQEDEHFSVFAKRAPPGPIEDRTPKLLLDFSQLGRQKIGGFHQITSSQQALPSLGISNG